ncbi:thermonuclease family protein [Paenibacillus sp. N1-5-1-14]|uniref:thermonuclease family protein n=1 Tax=Paenibacillus radicibacter TaxID=2972488 RepID=UPI00215902DA|nr:thermonuclease family protein [Paenibacillus radicibacter]MCR8641738.1 thermonuclease family protein [Paenibacillus radicibacter]
MRKFMYIGLVLSLCLAMLGCSNPSPSTKKEASDRTKVKVERVVDGDTLQITINGSKERLRLIGVDTPETKKADTPVMFWGEEASAYTKKRLEGKTVELEWDVEPKDQYGRYLAYIWIDDEMFNRTLIQEGYGRMVTFQPNVKYVDTFKKDQEAARKKGNGIWKDYDGAFKRK